MAENKNPIHPQIFIDVVTKQRDDATNQLANVMALNAHLTGILNERDARIEELEAKPKAKTEKA